MRFKGYEMDFSWSEEQNELYDTILHFAQDHFSGPGPRSKQFWTREQWNLCREAGLLGLCAPPEYGGMGLNALLTARALEAFGRGCEDMGLVFSVAAHVLACVKPLAEYGSEVLKKAWLPGLCSGTSIAANAITEQEAGSDVFALKTRATLDGDVYILNGVKSYVSNGPCADLFVVYASTNPAYGYLGITGFVISRDTPGLSLSEPIAKIGLQSTPACQLSLNECRVPVAWRIGAEGQGAHIFRHSMQWERTCLFAAYLGMMERQLEQTLAHARARRQFGKSIGKRQAIAHRLANMKLRLESARFLLYRACWQLDQGKNAALDISLAKLAVSEAAIQGGIDAIQIFGASGFGQDAGIGQMLLDALPTTLFSGTSEMQRDIIANELGL